MTVTTAITSPIINQVSRGAGSNPNKQTMDTGDKNSFAGSQRLHAQGNEGNGIRGVCHIPEMGVDNGHMLLKVSSQPHCGENRRYGCPGVLHCENQQEMVLGYGYQLDSGDKNSFAGSQQLHAQGSKGNDTWGTVTFLVWGWSMNILW